jgi:hypothetical protein
MTPEVDGLDWLKSTYSDAGNDCVEAAFVVAEDAVLIRDTKDRGGPVLRFTRSEWAAFLKGVGDGQFGFPE